MIKIYTIGFSGKTAEVFFGRLKNAGVKKVVDIRRWPDSQLSAFARGKDLPFFLKRLCGIGYQHALALAPSEELLKAYKDKQTDWQGYEVEYLKGLVGKSFNVEKLDNVCFLCSEPTAHQCHRRLLAEHIKAQLIDVEIVHL